LDFWYVIPHTERLLVPASYAKIAKCTSAKL
jgi:hypothetical protein